MRASSRALWLLLVVAACGEPTVVTQEAEPPSAAAPASPAAAPPPIDASARAAFAAAATGKDGGGALGALRLQGGACTQRACSPGECGLVDDGCRAEMWCGECACPTGVSTCERSLTQLWEQPISGPGTFTITVTQMIPTTIDPVLHVIDAAGNELAFDDNSAGGTLPRVTVALPAGQQRLVVLRPKVDTPSGGAALVTINGQSYLFGVRGRRHVFNNLRASEEIETVQLPLSTATHTIYAMSADELHIQGRVTGNGVAGGAVFTQPTATSRRVFWLGTGDPQPQLARLIRNDRRLSNHDLDGDGLGFELEAAIGTCSTLSGTATGKDGVAFSCGTAIDARDTDGDGLSDGVELRGSSAALPHQPLPRWGADPRHKDLFVEYDRSQLQPGEAAPRLSAAQARLFSDIYGDRVRDLTAAERAAHAAALGNPDGRPGIRTHLDIGSPAERAGEQTLYGDWGGNSVVPPVSPGVGAYPGTAWPTHLVPSRVGLFRYALLWNGFGGQTSTSDTCPGCGSYAWGSANDGGDALASSPAHESGHAQALAHSGPAGVHPLVDPNCKPTWPSLMNYAFDALDGFSDGTGVATVNNARAIEWAAVDPSFTSAVAVLRDDFKYKVSPEGHVDWNRDGVFAPAGSTVRAYINNQPGHGGCEFTRYNSQLLPAQMNAQLSPALAQLGGRKYLFAPGPGPLRYTLSSSDFDCPLGASCGSWSGVGTRPLDAARGVDVARVRGAGGGEALLVVGVDALGVTNYTLLRAGPFGAELWTAEQWSGLWGTTSGEPALETLPDGRALLLLRQANGVVMYGVFQYDGAGGGQWMHGGDALDCTTFAALQQKATASPGLARLEVPGVGPRVWALLNTPSAGFTLKSFDAAGLCFRAAELPLTSSWDYAGRPVGVWVPDAAHALGGKLHILGVDRNDDARFRHMSQLGTYVDAADGQAKVGLISGFDSIWARAYGLDAWYEPGEDDNLRAVWAMSPTLGGGDGQLNFYPRADAINDFDLVNYNDWPVLRYAVCKNLVNPTGQASNPIRCPVRPW